jgi:hypothetical protein
MLIFVAKILWSTTHAPQNAYMGAPQKRFFLLVEPMVQKHTIEAKKHVGQRNKAKALVAKVKAAVGREKTFELILALEAKANANAIRRPSRSLGRYHDKARDVHAIA